MLTTLIARSLKAFIILLTVARVLSDPPAASKQRVYYANHCSHGDFVLIWSALPDALRQHTRPVAGADYWCKTPLRRYLINKVFKGVLIERNPQQREQDPIAILAAAIEQQHALIIFPEGTRHPSREVLPFKSGVYHLAIRCPDLEFVPVWLDNLNRVMPKGRIVPLPLLCTVRFGEALRLQPNESKQDFLERTRTALLELAPEPSL